MDCASSRQRSSVPTPMPTSRATTSSAELSGGSNLATARSLNACPYRATLIFHRRPRVLGSIEATTILPRGGTQPLAADRLLVNISPEETKSALARSYLQSPVENSDNAYLVNTGQKLVLIDAGSGKLLGPLRGQLRANLIAAGYRPEQVDEIYLTHLHPDHVGGLADGDTMAFPNAIVRVDKKDADYWLSKENMDKAPEQSKRFFVGAMASLDPYIKAGRVKLFQGNTDLVHGVSAVASPGHTPGHSFFVAESKGQKIVFWGDLIHVLAVQFNAPSVGIAFDSDVGGAASQRLVALSLTPRRAATSSPERIFPSRERAVCARLAVPSSGSL